MIGTANAQWNQSPEIGSYQSILARTGYGASPVSGAVGSIPGSLPGAMQETVSGVVQNAMPGQLGSGTRNLAPTQHAMPGQLGSGTRNVAPMQHELGSGTRNMAPTQHAMPGQIDGTSYNMAPPNASMPYGGQTSYAPQVSSGCNGQCGGGGTVQYGGGGVYGDTSYGGGVASYADMGEGCSSGSCGAPVYTPGASIVGVGGGGVSSIVQGARSGGGVNRVGSIFGVTLRRNYEDPLRIGSNNGRDIFSDDIQNGDVTGIGASLASRNANGSGHELVYWGLDDDVTSNFNSPDFFSIGQLNDLNLDGFTAFEQFNNADSISVHRDFEINNFEANLLRNGGSYTTRRGKSGTFELLGGFRLFQFDESFRTIASGSAPYAQSTEYRLEAQNLLLGGQLGARNEVCLTNRLRLSSSVKAGVFNNRSETRQSIFNQDGTFATVVGGPADGRDFDYSDTQDDVAVLGEFKIGLIMQVSQRFRANAGYQVLGVGGVALAVDQVPLNTLDAGLLSRSRTNQSLLLHGFYFGGETCF